LDVLAFLKRIESADPNAPDISEDETNANWGHYQFTAGGMTCTTALSTWNEIGALVACKLIAAAFKTCMVARQICFKRGIQVGSEALLSNAYLRNLVESLWIAKNKAFSDVCYL
jgi:hypothetical protein